MPRVADLPASNLLRFLLSYGPEESNLNLFDEKVAQSSKRYNIQPIELSVRHVLEIERLLLQPNPQHILIAGVAGDGKSYHLRQVWTRLGGSPEEWKIAEDLTLEIALPNGCRRKLLFIKDLSAELTPIGEVWSILQRNEMSVVMACNHGQILSQLRAMKEPEMEDFANKLEESFFNAQADNVIDRIHVFDLSRVSQADRLQEIIQKVAMHPGWQNCDNKACEFRSRCFIRQNLNALWDREADRPTIVAKRLCELVKLAGLNGNHFPIRELFMLVINAVFGTRRLRTGALGDCHFVQNKFKDLKTVRDVKMDLFTNLLADNLADSQRAKKKEIFRHLSRFEVGAFGHPFFDDFILLGNEDPRPEVRALYQKYFCDLTRPDETEDANRGALSVVAKAERAKWLVEARRRIFFNWNKKGPDGSIIHESELWSLTAYPHAAEYLRLLEDMRENGDVDQDIPNYLISGLNRIMTGSTYSNANSIRLATNGADTRAPVGLLVVGQIFTNVGFMGQASMKMSSYNADAVPVLQFRLNPHSAEPPIAFHLTPHRYEFLVNLHEGVLPTSFSKQIQSEFYALKALLVRACLEQTGRTRTHANQIKIQYIGEAAQITIKLPKEIRNDE